MDSSSPSDSNNSNLSHGTATTTSSSDGGLELTECPMVDFYSASAIASMGSTFYSSKESTYPYR
jgi:hypothetical protein